MIVCIACVLQVAVYIAAVLLLCLGGLVFAATCASLRAIGESFGGLREDS